MNLKVEEGEFIAIVGFSGSGKTTLISAVAGLIEGDAGEGLLQGTTGSMVRVPSAVSSSSPIR